MSKVLVAQILNQLPINILDAKEAAKLLGIQHRSALKAAERGRLVGTKIGSTWFFTRADVEQYEAERKGGI